MARHLASARVLLAEHWPLLLAVVGFLGFAAAVLVSYRSLSSGAGLIYARDDPFIHMAIARNIVDHGVFGVTRYAFTSASSSPLWVMLLAIPYALGASLDVLPLVLNLLAGVGLLFVAERLLVNAGMKPVWRFAVHCLIVLHAPLIPVVFGGMEHVVHALISVAFLARAADVASRREDSGLDAGLLLLAPLLTSIRYEGLFLLAVVAALLVLRRRARLAVVTTLVGLAPVLVFGAFSAGSGGAILPNPLLLKPDRPDLTDWSSLFSYFTRGYDALARSRSLERLWVVGLVIVVVRWRRCGLGNPVQIFGLGFLGAALLHATFGRFGMFYRYEAYLMVLGLLALGLALGDYRALFAAYGGRARWIAQAAFAVLLLVYVGDGALKRDREALALTAPAMNEHVNQQYQMALFSDRFYSGRGVAVNDIGAISYYADVRLLDLFGLASPEVLRHKLAGTYTTEAIAGLARDHDVAIAMIYDRWFAETGLPEDWIKVAEWNIPERIVCADETVAFYAVAPEEAPALRAHLEAFRAELPRDVTQSIYHEPASEAADHREKLGN